MANQKSRYENANKRIAHNSIFMSIRLVIVLFLTFFTTRVLLNNLGVQDYGVYNVVCGFISLFSFMSTAMSNGIQRFFNYELGKNGIIGVQKVFNTSFLIQIIISLIFVLFCETIGIWYVNNRMVIPEDRMIAAVWIYHLSIIVFVLSILQSPYTAAVMAHECMDFYAVISVIDAILKLVIVYLLSQFNYDRLILYGSLILVVGIFNFVLYIFYCKKHFADEVKLKSVFDKKMFTSMLSFSGWNFFGSFSVIMKEQGINLIMNLFFGPVVNAARGVAAQINGGVQSFVHNLSIPVRPQVIQSYAIGDYNRTIALTLSISKLTCCLLYLLALPIVLEIDFILSLWLGNEVPEYTSSFIIIVILTSFINNLNSAVSGIVHASGKMRKYQLTTSLVTLLCLPSAYILLYNGFSPEYAVLMIFVFSALSHYVSLCLLQPIIGIKKMDYTKKVVLPIIFLFLCTAPVPLFISLIMKDSFIRFVLVISISLILVSIGIYYIVLDKGERTLIIKLLHIENLKLKKL